LGEKFRQLVSEEFPQGPISKVDEPRLQLEVDSFSRLVNNVYGQKYPRKFASATASGLDKESLQIVTTSEALNQLNKDISNKSRLDLLKDK
jgi:hypothetical protein